MLRGVKMVETNGEQFKGKVIDLLKYFREELAYECKELDLSEYETFLYNAKMIIDVLEKLHDIKNKELELIVEEHPMGGFIIREDID